MLKHKDTKQNTPQHTDHLPQGKFGPTWLNRNSDNPKPKSTTQHLTFQTHGPKTHNQNISKTLSKTQPPHTGQTCKGGICQIILLRNLWEPQPRHITTKKNPMSKHCPRKCVYTHTHIQAYVHTCMYICTYFYTCMLPQA